MRRDRARVVAFLQLAALLAIALLPSRARAQGHARLESPPPRDPYPSELTVAYTVVGKEDRTVFGLADVYTTRAIGEKVEVRYLREAPGEPMGPARVYDAAFQKFVPWGIGIFGAYLALQILISIARLIFRTAFRPPGDLKTTIGKEYD